MDYQAALEYILSFSDFERSPAIVYSAANFDLRRMEELLERLRNPHQRARSIEVAGYRIHLVVEGTNGQIVRRPNKKCKCEIEPTIAHFIG